MAIDLLRPISRIQRSALLAACAVALCSAEHPHAQERATVPPILILTYSHNRAELKIIETQKKPLKLILETDKTLNPTNAALFINRSSAYYAVGDQSKSVADFQEASRLDPKRRNAEK